MALEILKKETLIKAVENSVGANTWRSLMAREPETGEVKDILEDGEYSCAFFVTTLLYMTDLIDRPRATVASTRKALEESENWEEISENKAKQGDVIFWKKIRYPDGGEHAHVGFISTGGKVISTSYKEKSIAKHDPVDDGRVPDTYFRYKEF